jgi:hypothetical protein
MGEGMIEIIHDSDAVKANLAISSYTISNATNSIAYGKRLIGKATIKNNASKDFHGSVKLQLWNQKVGDNTAYSGPSRSFAIDILAGKTATVDFDFDNLNEGYYYRIKAMYVNQEGTLTKGGIWDFKWEMKAGLLVWTNNGTITGKAYSSSVSAGNTTAGIYANCNKISRMTPNKNNSNTIYAFTVGMNVPQTLAGYNNVVGGHADFINLVSDKPYYIPVSFDADSASFTYTFPETEDGTRWHAITMPFEVDSIYVDSIPVSLDDTLKHFWIYEFTAEGNNGEVIFSPATTLRGGTPYIIAGDTQMASKSIVFQSTGVPFYKTGTDKMLVTSPHFKFHGNTYAPRVKDCYILNVDGTAFDYTSTTVTLNGLESYFTTTLAHDVMPASIVLPEIPVSEDPTGIKETRNEDNNKIINSVYNLAGQRLDKMQKGINIVKGKKVLR